MEALTPRQAIAALSRLDQNEPILIGWWTRAPFENDLAESQDPDETWRATLEDISGGFDYEDETIYGAIINQINSTIEQEVY
jgi:hypothetical protein